MSTKPTLTGLELLLIQRLAAEAESIAHSSYANERDRSRVVALANLAADWFGGAPKAEAPSEFASLFEAS